MWYDKDLWKKNCHQCNQVGEDPQARQQEQVHREARERVGVWEPQHLAVQDGQEADQGQRDPGVVPPLQASHYTDST